jgi:hypothetical protein
MLRVSAEVNDESIDMRGVGSGSVDSGVAGDRVLTAITDAAVLRDPAELETASERCVGQLGEATTVRAFAVVGNFEMMNRLLDAIGVGPPQRVIGIGDEIGVPLPGRFRPPSH